MNIRARRMLGLLAAPLLWSCGAPATDDEGEGIDESEVSIDVSSKITERIPIPYLADGYVPQGVGLGKTVVANDTLFMAMMLQRDSSDPSTTVRIIDVDITGCAKGACTPVKRRTYRVLNADGTPMKDVHVSGVVQVGRFLYFSSPTALYQLDPSTAKMTTVGADLRVTKVWDRKIHTGAGLAYDPIDNRLYGFTDAAQIIWGYDLTAAGELESTKEVVKIPVPDRPWQDLRLQGGAPFHPGRSAATCFLLHMGRGTHAAELWKYCPETSKTAVTRVADDLPPHPENIAIGGDGMVWGITEGGALKFKGHAKNAHFVWGIPRTSLGIE